ncbi:ABC transporter substrate-binding protein [Nocardioides limicola]|uniref:ABC transporter substrate-binding protein n=1 Tax=Nocardioides limicola TaxID=2803368 RepID=UPI00193BBB47|nr:extracellular solute-binding protein [Nocardioides sp. DJM-14]
MRTATVSVTTGLVLLLVGCTGDPAPEPTVEPTPEPTVEPVEPTTLTVSLFGPEEMLAAWRDVLGEYDEATETVQVEFIAHPDRESAMAFLDSGEQPDLFLVDRLDLGAVIEADLNQRVDGLLADRNVEFGDGYHRAGLQGFSSAGALQCMPYAHSPLVMYYNTNLIDFDRMRARGLYAARPGGRWNFAQFEAAAEFATRPRRNTRGFAVSPDLFSLTPFLIAGGGRLFDDALTHLAFTEPSSQAALEASLELLRSPHLTPTEKQLLRRDPVELFEAGRIAMVPGYRDLVPRLRQVEGLEFDIMPMPSIERRATVGKLTGLCLGSQTEDPELAADLLAHLISDEAVTPVSETGYILPSNLAVSGSDAFRQPGEFPTHPEGFIRDMRDVVHPPLITVWDELTTAVADLMVELLLTPLLDLEDVALRIQEASMQILAPHLLLDEEESADEESADEGAGDEDSGD